MNGNRLPTFIRVLRAASFGGIGALILSATLLGADSTLARSQVLLGIGGACVAIVAIRFTRWRKSASTTRRLSLFSFIGAFLGTLIATVVFGGWALSDAIPAGLGAGLINGIAIALAVVTLRTAAVSFSK